MSKRKKEALSDVELEYDDEMISHKKKKTAKYASQPNPIRVMDNEDEINVMENLPLSEPVITKNNETSDEDGDDHGISNTKSQCGIIEKILVENFMCHRCLEVKLIPNVNFITGRNGSGKSAILAALQICLGAKATSTHRGSRLSNLIRKGHAGEAKLQVTLSNVGSDAYKPDIYGDRIIVERKIKRDGGGPYTLFGFPNGSRQPKKISNLKKELVKILDAFNIQVDNPCAVLDQENSKLFLKGDSKDKYKFFLKATDMMKLSADIRDSNTLLEQMKHTLGSRMQSQPHMKEDMEDAKALYKQVSELAKIDDKILNAKIDLAYAIVRDKKNEFHDVKESIDLMEIRKSKLETACKEEEIKVEVSNKEMAEFKSKQMEIQEEIKVYHRKEKEVKEELRERKKPIRKHETIVSNLESDVRSSEEAKAEYRKQLEIEKREKQKRLKELEKIMRNKEGRNAKYVEKYSKTTQELNEATARAESIEKSLNEGMKENEEITAKHRTLEEQIELCQVDIGQKHRKLQNIENTIDSMSSSKDDNINKFGRNMRKFRNLLDSHDGRFTVVPVGPIGMHVGMKRGKEMWTKAVETSLGGNLFKFILGSNRDIKLFKQLAAQSKVSADFFIRTDNTQARYRINANKQAHPSIITLERVVECDLDIVYNLLIDMNSMNGIMLTRTREEGESTYANDRMPNNIFSGLTSDGSSYYCKMKSKSFSHNKKGDEPPRLLSEAAASESLVAEEKKKYEFTKRELDQANKESEKLERTFHGIDDRVKKLRRDIARWNTDLKKCNTHIDKLERVNSRAHHEMKSQVNVDDDGDEMSMFEEEFLASQQEINNGIEFEEQAMKDKMEQIEESKREIDRLSATLEPLENSINEIRSSKQHHIDSLDETKLGVNELVANRSKLKHDLEKKKLKLKKIYNALIHLEKDVATLSKDIESVIQYASEIANGAVLADETIDQLPETIACEATLSQIQITKEQQAKILNIDFSKAEEDYHKKLHAYESINAELSAVKKNMKKAKVSQKKRNFQWREFRKYISHKVSSDFSLFLNERDQAGSVAISHEDGTLDIEMFTNKNNTSTATMIKDAKVLSGGERSNTTLMLLLALGNMIDNPFRCMDEFDIFMDDKNRKAALKTLINYACHDKHNSKQFILITPNDVSAVRDSPNVRIQEVRPPERQANGVINFARE